MTTALAFLDIALIVAFGILALGQIMSMVRLVIGPTPGDRTVVERRRMEGRRPPPRDRRATLAERSEIGGSQRGHGRITG